MIKTALDGFTPPPSAQLLGWHLLDARPSDGWLKVGFDWQMNRDCMDKPCRNGSRA